VNCEDNGEDLGGFNIREEGLVFVFQLTKDF